MPQPDSNKFNLVGLLCASAALLGIIGFATGKHHLAEFTGSPTSGVASASSNVPPPASNFSPPIKTPVFINPGPTVTETPPAPVPDQTAQTERLTAEVKSAIETADAAEIRAYATLDTSALESVYSGEALRRTEENINQLRMVNMHQVDTLVSRTYDDIHIDANGQNAKVRMTERWSDQKYSNGNNELVGSAEPEKDVPQTAYLHKEERGWIITTIDFDN